MLETVLVDDTGGSPLLIGEDVPKFWVYYFGQTFRIFGPISALVVQMIPRNCGYSGAAKVYSPANFEHRPITTFFDNLDHNLSKNARYPIFGPHFC